jgi:2-polyprenyl-6-methoxyphenol hydroxylase-like FAD-dependent oxidoreductase
LDKSHLAIIGCGTAGLAAGIALARLGHRVTLFERFKEATPVGAGILLQPTGLAALRRLGLLEQMEATGARIEAMEGETVRGRRIMDVRYRDAWPEAYGLGVHRGNLFRLLFDAAVQAGVEMELGREVVELRPGDKPRLLFDDGRESPAFDAVIVANGTQSTLRKHLKIPSRNTPYPWGALWSICDAGSVTLRPVLEQRYRAASMMIGMLPTGTHPNTRRPCVSFFWSLKAADYARWKSGDFRAWQYEVVGHWPEAEPVVMSLTGPESLAFATYADVVMPRWHAGRAVIIGDAAHGMSPQLGQGTNLALLDALALGECVTEKATLEEAFASYTRRRRGHLRYYQWASRWLTPFFQSDSRVAAAVRDAFAPLLHRIPFTYKESLRTIAGVKTGILFEKPLYPGAGDMEARPGE